MGMFLGIIRQRCPRCRRGPIFHGLMSTHERCGVCGLRFEREPGYFVGAMYTSYAFGLVTTAYWLPLLLLGVSPLWVLLPPALQLVVQLPITFRYSRVLWLYLDRGFDPDEETPGPAPTP
jgi:uncharacterized protein (DUF983 family)